MGVDGQDVIPIAKARLMGAADLRQLRHPLNSQVVCATLSVSLPQEFRGLLSSFQVTAHFVV